MVELEKIEKILNDVKKKEEQLNDWVSFHQKELEKFKQKISENILLKQILEKEIEKNKTKGEINNEN